MVAIINVRFWPIAAICACSQLNIKNSGIADNSLKLSVRGVVPHKRAYQTEI